MMNNLNKTHDYFRRRFRGLLSVCDDARSGLARAMCVPFQTVLQWESGEKIPDVYQFREIADFFGLPYAWFLDGSDGMPDAEVMAERLGLSEGTVETLMEIAKRAPDHVLDDMDDCLFQIATAIKSDLTRMRGGRQ